jgi:ABC-2 type transport system ATP-binding protein
MSIVDVRDLRKAFGSVQALDGVSFSVEQGEIFGLLGPNGAGKTTTVRIMTGVLKPDSGQALIAGHEVSPATPDVRRMIGVVPQQITVYEELTATDNLVFWGRLYGLGGDGLGRRIEELFAMVGLEERAGDKVATYSGGMKRRLNLCMGLIHEPRVLVLDEPTLGIDPQARLLLLERVEAIASGGTAVIYTTHYLEEAESLCNRLAIIDHGRVLATGSLDELMQQVRFGDLVRIRGSFDPARDREQLAAIHGATLATIEESQAVLEVDADSRLPAVLSSILAAIPSIQGVAVEKPTLQSLFIQLTGRELRDQ